MQLHRKLFEISWRLALLSLPWQTRIFWDAQLAGWPWEQGRISIYASWLLVTAAVLLGLTQKQKVLQTDFKRTIFWFLSALAGVTLVAMPYPTTAAIQWWLQVVLLLTFGIVLFKARVGLDKVFFWFALGLIPQALMGVWQFFGQTVFESRWLGMAGQDPALLGVSVVQTQMGRYLRAYGGSPHPNIFGAWMSFGLLLVFWLASIKRTAVDRCPAWCWRLMGGLFSMALFYSFSRSAWLALAAGGLVFAIYSGLKNGFWKNKYLLLPVILLMILSVMHHDLVFTRLGSSNQRLETKSVVTRMQTIRDGVLIFQNKLWFGTGPNSELPVLARIKQINQSPAPLETTHLVWLLILVNYGIVGGLFVFGFGLFILRRFLDQWKHILVYDKSMIMSLGACLVVLGSLDHHLWTTWSGQIMAGLFFMALLSVIYSEEVE
ncbi:MAG TPA: O-antigen ligase family protein [bacterium]|nr:MAG: O-Antigen ligase [Parcubacteria group bacterium ADurb.Bin192]HPN15377.1 O-antigen ligase family protein [bacterium]